ncbi:unnamed protein product [Sphagnum jensenii]|uniref:Uncharacterized protein n=1 Tax=Sphagnum jensenii TaxID=128206 RepID=A0ABP0XE83_9BRYO
MLTTHDVFAWNAMPSLGHCEMWTEGVRIISNECTGKEGLEQDAVTFTVLLKGQKALEEGGVEADPVTFVGLLNACASAATLERRQVS